MPFCLPVKAILELTDETLDFLGIKIDPKKYNIALKTGEDTICRPKSFLHAEAINEMLLPNQTFRLNLKDRYNTRLPNTTSQKVMSGWRY
jgi:ribonuclease HIII